MGPRLVKSDVSHTLFLKKPMRHEVEDQKYTVEFNKNNKTGRIRMLTWHGDMAEGSDMVQGKTNVTNLMNIFHVS